MYLLSAWPNFRVSHCRLIISGILALSLCPVDLEFWWVPDHHFSSWQSVVSLPVWPDDNSADWWEQKTCWPFFVQFSICSRGKKNATSYYVFFTLVVQEALLAAIQPCWGDRYLIFTAVQRCFFLNNHLLIWLFFCLALLTEPTASLLEILLM